jgi:hypothetical protein
MVGRTGVNDGMSLGIQGIVGLRVVDLGKKLKYVILIP